MIGCLSGTSGDLPIHGKLGLFKLPGLSPIKAPGKRSDLGLGGINRMPATRIALVIPQAEPDENLVTPTPQPIVGGPASEPARLAINQHMLAGNSRERTAVNRGRIRFRTPVPVFFLCGGVADPVLGNQFRLVPGPTPFNAEAPFALVLV